jgi:hypothetical protein
LPPLQIIAMATVNRLHSEPIELMASRGGEQILIVGAPCGARARTRLVDIFGDNLLAGGAPQRAGG